MRRGNGSIIGPKVTATSASASGMWSMVDAQTNAGVGTWPKLIPNGQQAYTTPGTYTWTAPAGVTVVSVVLIGAGAGGSGTGDAGSSTAFGITVYGGKGGNPGVTQSVYGTGAQVGYIGGAAGSDSSGTGNSGGGGAAGYAGNGGKGGDYPSGLGTTAPAGSGAGSGGNANNTSGGGVGIFGKGADGAANGGGGSGGTSGTAGSATAGGNYGGGASPQLNNQYAGGGGCLGYSNNLVVVPGTSYTIVVGAGRGSGASGAVRIIWGNFSGTRAFPSTLTQDL